MKVRSLLVVFCILAMAVVAMAQSVDGKWDATVTNQRGETHTIFEFKNAGGTVTGTITRQGGGGGGNAPMPVEIKNGKFAGGTLTFEVSQPGRGGAEPTVIKYTGKVGADSIKFTTEGGRGAQEMEAKKVK